MDGKGGESNHWEGIMGRRMLKDGVGHFVLI